MKKLNVELRMGRNQQDYKQERPFHLTITDEASRVVLLEVSLSREDFCDLLSNRAAHPCPAEYRDNSNIGKTMEVKDVIVVLPEDRWDILDSRLLAERIYTEAQTLVSDGWIVDRNGGYNHHEARLRDDKRYVYRCTARRWV